MKLLSSCLLLIVFFATNYLIAAQDKSSIPRNNQEIQKLKNLYWKYDFDEAFRLGKELSKKFPNDLELRAWTIINGAKTDNSGEVLKLANGFFEEKGENYYTLLALAHAQYSEYLKESAETAAKLIKIAPADEEAILAQNLVYRQNREYQKSLDWLEKNSAHISNKSRLLVAKALSTYQLYSGKDSAKANIADDLFAQAVKISPRSVDANYLFGNYLSRNKKYDEAIPYLRSAVRLSPGSVDLNSAYWKAIRAQTKKSEPARKAEFEQALNQYLTWSKNSPQSFLTAWNEYSELAGWREEAKIHETQRRDYFANEILKRYPNTKYDEEVLFSQINTAYGKYFGKDDTTKRLEIWSKKEEKITAAEAKYIEASQRKDNLLKIEQASLRRAFIRRPKHFDSSKLGRVYVELFRQIADDASTGDAEIADLVAGVRKHFQVEYQNVNSLISKLLFARKEAVPQSEIDAAIEKYALLGVEEANKKIEKLSPQKDKIKIKFWEANAKNILAQAYIVKEKFEEAEKLLAENLKLIAEDYRSNSDLEYEKNLVDHNYFRLYSARKQWSEAEKALLKITLDNADTRKTFSKFYAKQYQKSDGFDEYYTEIRKKLRAAAREKVLALRIDNPAPLTAFSLKTIDGRTVSLADLQNRVAVINLWGTWCAPCVAEMPELQQLYDDYKDDQEVIILTIDSGDELDTVKGFMSQRNFTFPVLMDNGYISNIALAKGGIAFPTTYFVDKSGKIAFVKVGNSGSLFEEFGWRIEALKKE